MPTEQGPHRKVKPFPLREDAQMGRLCARSSVPLLLSLNCVRDRLLHGLLPVQVPPRSLTAAERPQAGGPQPGKAAPDGHGYHGVHQRGEPAAENHP